MACGWQNSCRPWSCNYLQNAGATTYKNFLQFYAKKACKKHDTFIKYLLFVSLFILSWNIDEFILDITETYISQNIENNVFRYYIDKLYHIRPGIIKENNTGYVAGLIQKVIAHQEKTFRTLLSGLCLDIVYLIYCACILAKDSVALCISLLLIYLLSNVGRAVITSVFTNKYASKLAEAEGFRSRQYIDVATNINTVQKMDAIDCFDKKFDKTCKDILKKTKAFSIWDEIGFMFAKGSAFAFTPVALLILYIMSKNGIVLSVTSIAFLTSVCIQFPHNVRNIARAISYYSRFKTTVDKLEDIINDQNRRMDKVSGVFDSACISKAEYSYKLDEKAIKINIPYFHVSKGDFVCIYGQSGQGKTTLLNLLSQEIENDYTRITCVCDNNLVTYMRARLDCVFISQDTEIFDMSVRDNLTLGKNIPDEILVEFITRVGMLDWLEHQEYGLDTILGERGVFVSTGQRQRLNLIRGLLIQDKEVYLLDEPTSNVDSETEEKIIELIKEVLKDKTVLIITHRDAIKSICNKKYVFRDGTLYKD